MTTKLPARRAILSEKSVNSIVVQVRDSEWKAAVREIEVKITFRSGHQLYLSFNSDMEFFTQVNDEKGQRFTPLDRRVDSFFKFLERYEKANQLITNEFRKYSDEWKLVKEGQIFPESWRNVFPRSEARQELRGQASEPQAPRAALRSEARNHPDTR